MKESDQLKERLLKEDAELDAIRQGLQGKTSGLQKQIEEQQQLLAPWTEKINDKMTELDVNETEFNLLAKRINSGAVALQSAETEVETTQNLVVEKQCELTDKKQKHLECIKMLKSAEDSIQSVLQKQTKLRDKLEGARDKCDEAKTMMQASQSRGGISSTLIRESDAGRIKGVLGRLGDLGAIDDKYDVAITTACGSLDSIVVETVETAQNCIEYLKKHNLGKATFMCLDKLRKWDTSPIQTPEQVPRLFDLIKLKEQRFAPAFYQALTNTLVANDLVQANRIAFGKSTRFRVVTLEGQLIDVSGTMSGGGGRPQRGGMSSKFAQSKNREISPAKLVEYEEARDKAEQSLKYCDVELLNYQEDLRKWKLKQEALSVEISKLEIEVNSLAVRLNDATVHLEAARSVDDVDPADEMRKAELEQLIARLNPELKELEIGAKPIESKIVELQNKILEIGGVKLRSQNAKVDSLNEQIKAIDSKMTKLHVERGSRESSITKIAKSIEKRQTEIDEIETSLADFKSSWEKQRSESKDLRLRNEAIVAELEQMQQELEKLKDTRDERAKVMNESRSIQLELKTRMNESARKLSERKKLLNNCKQQLAELTIQSTGYFFYMKHVYFIILILVICLLNTDLRRTKIFNCVNIQKRSCSRLINSKFQRPSVN